MLKKSPCIWKEFSPLLNVHHIIIVDRNKMETILKVVGMTRINDARFEFYLGNFECVVAGRSKWSLV